MQQEQSKNSSESTHLHNSGNDERYSTIFKILLQLSTFTYQQN